MTDISANAPWASALSRQPSSAPRPNPATTRLSTGTCPLCGASDTHHVLTMPSVPAHIGLLWSSPEAAKNCPAGPIDLALCRSCGLVFNTAFKEDLIEYSEKYDNALHGSAVFRSLEQTLVRHLVSEFDLRGVTVADIGCGPGHFLGLLCREGGNSGIGIDPSHDPLHVDPEAQGRVRFVREPFSRQRLSDVKFVCCRQTLEHVDDPVSFLTSLHDAMDDQAIVYVDVPDSWAAFRNLSIWELIYEHPLYFTAPTLRYAFERTAFTVLDLWTSFDGQFLSIEARAGSAANTEPPRDGLETLARDVTTFGRRFEERRSQWRARLDDYRQQGLRVALWGAGARGVMFFNILGVTDEIGCAVDVNPRKQGAYVPGTGHPILAPDALAQYQPDLVIITNPRYTTEISESLAKLGVRATVVVA